MANPQPNETIEGEILAFPAPQRNIQFSSQTSLRKVDPSAVEVRRSGPFGVFENTEDVAHREALIKGDHLADEMINIEGNTIRAEVHGVAHTLEGADALLRMVDATTPNTTLGRLAEDMAGRSITNLREGHFNHMGDLDAEARNLFRNRRR